MPRAKRDKVNTLMTHNQPHARPNHANLVADPLQAATKEKKCKFWNAPWEHPKFDVGSATNETITESFAKES